MSQPIFKIRKLSYAKRGRVRLSIINFEIHRGIVYVIMGQAGAGKSTLLELLAGSIRPTAGTLLYDDQSLAQSGVRQRHAREVCFVPQQLPSGWRTVEHYMLKNLMTATWSTGTPSERLKTVSKQMDVTDLLKRPLHSLSPGERRWINLTVHMACDAKVLIIDEVEQHLSYDALDLVRRQIQRKSHHEGTTVILSTMNPTHIRHLSGVAVTLDRGRIAMIRSLRTADGGRSGQAASGSRRAAVSASRPARPTGEAQKASASVRGAQKTAQPSKGNATPNKTAKRAAGRRPQQQDNGRSRPPAESSPRAARPDSN